MQGREAVAFELARQKTASKILGVIKCEFTGNERRSEVYFLTQSNVITLSRSKASH